jgi:predicted nucleic acid-binding protein
VTLTYVDSGVLIFAARGTAEAAALALPFLRDPTREFVTSEYVRLEVLPKPTYFQRQDEVDFYNAFFALNQRTIPTSSALLELAMQEACKVGLSAIDALHVACGGVRGCRRDGDLRES